MGFKDRYEPIKELRLSSTDLNELPGSIGNLSSLKRLDLENNKLKELPEGIGTLTSLEYLVLQNNPLRDGECERIRGELRNTHVWC